MLIKHISGFEKFCQRNSNEDNANNETHSGNRTIFAPLLPVTDHENRKLGGASGECLPQLLMFPSKQRVYLSNYSKSWLLHPFSLLNSGPFQRYVHLEPVNAILLGERAVAYRIKARMER